jgi:hypothetical protein
MSKIFVAVASATVFIDTQRVHIIQGTAWAADSVTVNLHPEFFSDDPRRALGLDLIPPLPESQPEVAAEPEPEAEPELVEQKTAAPGEKSSVKRRG